ncbi:hypothetical protein GE061_000438 [Apolygus lucorum]|uniref:Uncharacterized protein n=1 Tax=Apolygus lucorum TaxID=248454 RepID=A0A8S9Y4B6_APOLU|nr:hypothetical protein GE061_000438 [Apolygus lucorum]
MKEKKTLNNCDPRLRWVMDRVLRYFQLNDETLAVNMLERHNGRAKKRLQCLFSGLDRSSKVFYAYQTTYPKTFYKEVTIRKEVPRPKESSPQTSDRDENSEDSTEEDKKKKKEPKKKKKIKKKLSKGAEDPGEEGEKETVKDVEETVEKPPEDANEDDQPPEFEDADAVQTEAAELLESDSKDEPDSKKSKKSKKSGKVKKRPKSPASVVETLPTGQTEQPVQTATMTIKMKRIIRKEKKLSQLHIRFGQIPWNNIRTDLTYVYFLRRNCGDIPIFQTYHEANSEMPKYFYVGQLKESLIEAFLKYIQGLADIPNLLNVLPDGSIR